MALMMTHPCEKLRCQAYIFILVARIDFAIASANWKRNFSVIWISTSLFWGGASVWSMGFRAFPKKNDHRSQAHLSNIAFHSRSILIHTRSGRLFSYASSFVLFFCFTSHSFIRIARTLYTKSTFIFFCISASLIGKFVYLTIHEWAFLLRSILYSKCTHVLFTIFVAVLFCFSLWWIECVVVLYVWTATPVAVWKWMTKIIERMHFLTTNVVYVECECCMTLRYFNVNCVMNDDETVYMLCMAPNVNV